MFDDSVQGNGQLSVAAAADINYIKLDRKENNFELFKL